MDDLMHTLRVLFVLVLVGAVIYLVVRHYKRKTAATQGTESPSWEAIAFAPVEEDPVEKAARPPAVFKLAYANALGRLSDADWQALHAEAPGILERLKKATSALEDGASKHTEGLLIVSLTHIRGSYGRGVHWLEALVLSDLAMFCHFAGKAEDSAWRFGQAEEVVAKWVGKYPWLTELVAKRRSNLARKRK